MSAHVPRSLLIVAALAGCVSHDAQTGDTGWASPLDTAWAPDVATMPVTKATQTALSTGEPFTVSLDGLSWVATPTGQESGPAGLTTRGTLDDGGTFTLVQRGRAWAGTLQTAAGLVQLQPAGPDAVQPVLVGHDAMPPCAEPVPVGDPYRSAPSTSRAAVGPTRSDLLVVYTAKALAGAGSAEAINAVIALAEAETNEGLSASGVDHRVRVVHTALVSGEEQGAKWGVMLDDLRGDGDGFADEALPLREQYGADQVVLLVDESTACGIAYVMTTPTASFAGSAFSVVSRVCATGYYSFAHELGHNMGSAHNKSYGESAAYPWAYGHQDPDDTFRTIMAYNCAGGCPRLNRWSDPGAQSAGLPLGVSGSGETAADNHRALGETRALVAAFRDEAATSPATAHLTSPKGSTLVGGAAHLAWTSTGTDSVRVTVGYAPGEADLVDATVSGETLDLWGLPITGAPLWVRLWTPNDAGWSSEDTRLDVAPADAASLIVPASSDVVSAPTATFAWTDTGAPRYRLTLGTSAGGDDVADIVTTGVEATARELTPGPLYATLAWESDQGWRQISERRLVAPTSP